MKPFSNSLHSTPIVLASNSPRRLQLLSQIGIPVAEVLSPDIDESAYLDELPADYVIRIAKAKVNAVATLRPDSIVIAADTAIALEGEILGKPTCKEDAFKMWQKMSNRWHHVLTAVSICYAAKEQTLLNTSAVFFAELSEENMEMYWQSKEPLDKAGAYAIQGLAAVWIKEIQGSYSGIMGLPLFETALMLKTLGVKTLI